MAEKKDPALHDGLAEHADTSDATSAGDQSAPDDDDAGYWFSLRFIGTLLAIMLLANSLFIGYAMPVNILGVIDADLGPSPNIYLVSFTSTLGGGVMLLIVGRLSDILGRRYFLIGCQLLALIGSIVAATASSVNTVIAGSVLIGIAAGGQQLYPLIIQEMVPNKYRFHGQAAITISVMPTIGFSPAIARSLVENTALAWRWCYWLNVIICGLSIVLLAIFYFPPSFHMINKKITRMQELRRLDYGGLFLYCLGLVLLLLGFTWSQGKYSWGDAHVLGPVISGAAVVAGFFFYQIYFPLSQPLMPMRLLKIRNFAAVVVVGVVGQMVYYVMNLLWPKMITVYFTTDNIKIGLMSSTPGASLAFGEIIIAPFFKLIGRPRWQLGVSSVLVTIFVALMSLVDQDQQSLGIALTVLSGVCVGWIEGVAIVIAGLVVPPNDIGVAGGFFASMRAVLGTIALSIYVSIYQSRLDVVLPRDITNAVENAGLPESSLPALFDAIANGTASAMDAVPGMNDTILAAVETGTQLANHTSYKVTFLASIAFGSLAIIASVFVRDVSHLLTNDINKKIRRPGKRVVESNEGNVEKAIV